ncbi:MAG: hypothetical protein WAW11_02685 [Patescibacteria group bacterium]
MSHEIEADFVAYHTNEDKQCHKCTSYAEFDGKGYCSELQMEVPPVGHCDFFQSKDF